MKRAHRLTFVAFTTALVATLAPAAQADLVPTRQLDIWPELKGFWFGQATQSPFGVIPYALAFTTAGETIVAETPPPPGGALPKGAYQRFVIGHDTLTYKASLGDGFAEGTLTTTVGNPRQRLEYCAPEGPDHSGGCGVMKVSFDLDPDHHLVFDTYLKGALHSRIVLTPMGTKSPLKTP